MPSPLATSPSPTATNRNRQWTARGLGRLLLALTALAGRAQVSPAQAIRAPLDFMSGAVLNAPEGTSPFAGAVRLGVTTDLGGRGRLGVVGGLLDTGGNWKAAGGVRGGMRLVGALDLGLYGYGEVLIGDNTLPLSLGLVVELPVGVSLRTGLWFTRDTEAETTSLALILGTDLDFWLRHKGPPPPRRPGDEP